MNVKYRVTLTVSERAQLVSFVLGGKGAYRRLKRAQILLAADKGAIDVGLAHEFACVLRFNTPTVLNADALGGGIIGHFVQSMANECVRFLRLSGRRVAAGADGPDRLICNHCLLQFLWT